MSRFVANLSLIHPWFRQPGRCIGVVCQVKLLDKTLHTILLCFGVKAKYLAGVPHSLVPATNTYY